MAAPCGGRCVAEANFTLDVTYALYRTSVILSMKLRKTRKHTTGVITYWFANSEEQVFFELST